ncbi:hypothetical protein RHOSPDRAFT_36860 [Rhodotorula sp. JG-1b]|nr:hypothetical protein RHOSPDRAFT_36860 [Rhodotorula sp. JG-1b]
MASPRSVAVAIIFASPSPPRDTAAAPDSHAIAPYNDDKDDKGPTFLLVSSRKKKNRYVFPKGGIEHGERSPEAAERESWEEAGLRPGTARHLTHLLVLQDPSAHILSPSSDVDSPSFVASCQYSFELFFLPPPPPSAAPDQERIPNKTKHLESSTAASSETATESEEAKEDGSRTSHNARIPPSDSDPPAIATSSLPAAYESTYLSPTWPESTERDRVLVRGWSALENAVCWGRREQVMREAIRQARHWIEEEQQGEQGEEQELGRIPNAEQRQSVEVKPA